MPTFFLSHKCPWSRDQKSRPGVFCPPQRERERGGSTALSHAHSKRQPLGAGSRSVLFPRPSSFSFFLNPPPHQHRPATLITTHLPHNFGALPTTGGDDATTHGDTAKRRGAPRQAIPTKRPQTEAQRKPLPTTQTTTRRRGRGGQRAGTCAARGRGHTALHLQRVARPVQPPPPRSRPARRRGETSDEERGDARDVRGNRQR